MGTATLVLALSGCGRGAPALPTHDLEPLEDNRAAFPGPGTPEALSVVSGGDSGLWWAHAQGYLHAPIAEVWAAARDPEVVVDRREVDEWTVGPASVEGLDESYLIHNVVRDLLTVEYDLWWRHELQAGTTDAPERVVARWDKTEGTAFIALLSGTMVIWPVGGDLTAVELVEHLDAAARDDQTLISYLGDLHASLAAASRGEPLPTW